MPPRANWILLAMASGGFAALNGLFAKLTTASGVTPSALDSGCDSNKLFGLVIRAAYLALNMASNIVMWTLFTRALTASPSATKVSITNTAVNFILTAVLGSLIFGEDLPWMWWLGAGVMGTGCVMIGMKDGEGGG